MKLKLNRHLILNRTRKSAFECVAKTMKIVKSMTSSGALSTNFEVLENVVKNSCVRLLCIPVVIVTGLPV